MIKLMKSDLKALENALLNKRWNLWIKIGKYGEIYFRRTQRKLEDEIVSCLDVATSNIKEKYRGQKIYTQVMDYIEKNARVECIYHENVLNEQLSEFLVKAGNKPDRTPNCYYHFIGK